MKWLGIMLVAALLAGAPAYGRAEQPKGLDKKGEQAPKSVQSYTPAEKEAYQKKIASDLEELQQKIDELKIKGRTVVQQKKRMIRKGLIALQNKANAARDKLATLKTAPKEAWSDLKADMDKAMKELTKAYDEMELHLR